MQSQRSPFVEHNPVLQQADAAAAKAMSWCLRKLRLKDVPVPVPIDVWIERPMGLRLDITDLSMFGEDTEGNTNMAEFEIQIEEKLLDDECRFRFACAHEVGHMVMHRTAKRVFAERSHIPETLLNLHESQADRFALNFLMPIQSLFDRLFWLADERRVDHPKFIEMLMTEGAHSESLWCEYVLPDVQSRFGIGVHHVINRVESLRLRRNGRPFFLHRMASALRRHFPSDLRRQSPMDQFTASGGVRR